VDVNKEVGNSQPRINPKDTNGEASQRKESKEEKASINRERLKEEKKK